jgi:hypothetical protein
VRRAGLLLAALALLAVILLTGYRGQEKQGSRATYRQGAVLPVYPNTPAGEVVEKSFPQSRIIPVPEYSGIDGGVMTFKVIRPDGARFWVSCVWNSYPGGENKPRSDRKGYYSYHVKELE